MKTFGKALDLKNDPEIIEKYKEYHRNVWPEVKDSLGEIGITAMRIFCLGNHLFMYMETVDDFDPDGLQEYTEKNPRAGEWNDLMFTFQQVVPEAAEGELWAAMEQVYDLDW
jgi:L-rhamnose mutarotase